MSTQVEGIVADSQVVLGELNNWGTELFRFFEKERTTHAKWLNKLTEQRMNRVLPGTNFLQIVISDAHIGTLVPLTHDSKEHEIVALLADAGLKLLDLSQTNSSTWLSNANVGLKTSMGCLYGRISILRHNISHDLGAGFLTFTVSLNGSSYFEGRDAAGEIALMLHELNQKIIAGSTYEHFEDHCGALIAIFHWNKVEPQNDN